MARFVSFAVGGVAPEVLGLGPVVAIPKALALAGLGAAIGFGHVLAQSLAIGPDHAGAYRPAYDLDWFLACFSAPAFGALPFPDLTSEQVWNSSVMGLLPAPWNAIVPALKQFNIRR